MDDKGASEREGEEVHVWRTCGGGRVNKVLVWSGNTPGLGVMAGP